MRKTLMFLMALTLAAALTAAGSLCVAENTLLLYLSFDASTGAEIEDESGHLPAADIEYRYLNPTYTAPMGPEWRKAGVSGGTLLFDGASTFIAWEPEEICLQGEALTISVWVAPRSFEWDDPNAADAGEARLTAIVGQYCKAEKQGLLLGYQRFGRLCLEFGTGDGWFTLWTDEERLTACKWNHVAAVFDGAKGKAALYLNGEEAAAIDIPKGSSIAPAVRERLLIGKNAYGEQIAAGNYRMFSGLMDELQIRAQAFSPNEIRPMAEIDIREIDYEEIALSNILTGDIYKTQYHGGPYRHWMNEPHAPLYYNGLYHLFFQSNNIGTYWRNISWGHLVSEDTVHWRPVRDAIVPTENTVVPDGVWSGGATLDANGVPVLFFTAGNDSFRDAGLISNQNIGAAYPKDLTDPELTDWVICEELAVPQKPGQGRAGEFRDPHIWKEGETWYMLVCSGSSESTGGSALFYVTDRLEVLGDGRIDMDWQYNGPVYEMENQSVIYGTSWELPILIPLTNRDGSLQRWAFFISPAPAGIADNKVYYFIGDFDRESGKFTPDKAMNGLPRMLDYGSNVFTGPSVLQDPVTGRVCMFSIMQDQRSGAEEGAAGWAHCVGLTRNLYLSDDGADVCVEPDPRLYSLLDRPLLTAEDVAVEEANALLNGVSGDLLYIHAELCPADSASSGIHVKYAGRREDTVFTYRLPAGTIEGTTSNRGAGAAVMAVEGALPLRDGVLEMEIFVDRSLVEGFFNSDKAVSVRSYAKPESRGIQFFADGDARIRKLEVYAVQSIYK